jgi:hypothetical protein
MTSLFFADEQFDVHCSQKINGTVAGPFNSYRDS